MGSTQVQSLRPPEPVTIEDRLEIMELAARFDLMVDRHDVDGYAELFTSGGVLEHPAAPSRVERRSDSFWLITKPPRKATGTWR